MTRMLIHKVLWEKLRDLVGHFGQEVSESFKNIRLGLTTCDNGQQLTGVTFQIFSRGKHITLK